MNSNQIIYNFTSDVSAKAEMNDITLALEPTKMVPCPGDDVPVLGFFDDANRVLSVATEDEDWLGTLAHEASHMDQFIDGSEYWNEDLDGAYEVWMEAMENPEAVSDEDFKAALNTVILLEADCERRAVEKIKKYNLPVDVEDYCRKANAYLYFHTAMLKYRKWYKVEKHPGKMGVTATMPSTLQDPEHYLIGEHDVSPDRFAVCF